jgi:hypothetical protein
MSNKLKLSVEVKSGKQCLLERERLLSGHHLNQAVVSAVVFFAVVFFAVVLHFLCFFTEHAKLGLGFRLYGLGFRLLFPLLFSLLLHRAFHKRHFPRFQETERDAARTPKQRV